MSIYHNNFSLRRLAAITYSKKLWACELREPLKFCIDNQLDAHEELVGEIEKQIDERPFPQEVREELLFVVGMMGHDIWNVKCTLDRAFNDKNKSPEEIFVFKPERSVWLNFISWSYLGRIDYQETLQGLYMANLLPVNIPTWMHLCYSCLDSCLETFFPKMSPELQADLRKTSYAGHPVEVLPKIVSVILLLTYWNARHVAHDNRHVIHLFGQFIPGLLNKEYEINENMFVFSCITTQYFATEYFWNLLDADQQRRAFATVCTIFDADGPGEVVRKLFFTESTMDSRSLVFFLKLLAFYERDDIRIRILGSGFVLERLLYWTHCNLFIETVREAALYHPKINYNPIVLKLCTIVCFCGENELVRRDVHYRKIFYDLWKMNPRNLKTSVVYPVLFKMMWWQRELELMSFLLRDEDLLAMRKMFLFSLVSVCRPTEIDNEFYQIFTAECLDSDAERNWFRAKIMVRAPRVVAVNGV